MSINPQTSDLAENDAIALSDDISFSPLAQEGNVEWFLCRHAVTGETFVLATAGNEESVFQVTQLLKNEYALRTRLSERWALKPLSHTLCQGRYALIYSAFNYRTLADILSMPLAASLNFLPAQRCSAIR